MGVLVKDMVTNIRDLLGMPEHGSLPHYRVLLRLQRVIDHYRNLANITDADWILSSTILPVDASTDIFPVTASNWGRPVLINSISDASDSDKTFVKHTYPMCDVTDAHLFYLGPTQATTAPMPAPHVATSFAFFSDVQNNQMVKVTPQHVSTAFYQIWYEPDRPDPPNMNDQLPIFPAYVGMMEVHTAMDCFPAVAKGMDEVTRAETKERLHEAYGDLRKVFETYVRSDVKEQVGPRRGWTDPQDFMGYWYNWAAITLGASTFYAAQYFERLHTIRHIF